MDWPDSTLRRRDGCLDDSWLHYVSLTQQKLLIFSELLCGVCAEMSHWSYCDVAQCLNIVLWHFNILYLQVITTEVIVNVCVCVCSDIPSNEPRGGARSEAADYMNSITYPLRQHGYRAPPPPPCYEKCILHLFNEMNFTSRLCYKSCRKPLCCADAQFCGFLKHFCPLNVTFVSKRNQLKIYSPTQNRSLSNLPQSGGVGSLEKQSI